MPADDPEKLKAQLEEHQDRLHALDRALAESGRRPTAEDRRQRSLILREIHRLRRRIYQLLRPVSGKTRKLSLTIPAETYDRLAQEAKEAGLELRLHLIRKLTGQDS